MCVAAAFCASGAHADTPAEPGPALTCALQDGELRCAIPPSARATQLRLELYAENDAVLVRLVVDDAEAQCGSGLDVLAPIDPSATPDGPDLLWGGDPPYRIHGLHFVALDWEACALPPVSPNPHDGIEP